MNFNQYKIWGEGSMKKIFETLYDGRLIRVENRWFSGEKLYVDGVLQDENLGVALRATLNGQLRNGKEFKSIKVSIGGFFKIHCNIFVDHALIPSEQIEINR